MSSNKKTPLKLSPFDENNNHISLSNTPQCSIDSDNTITTTNIVKTPNNIVNQSAVDDDLAISFSTMKVTLGGSFKRNAESFTVEGSPMIRRDYKRMDINPTPFKSDNSLSNDRFVQTNIIDKLSLQSINNVVKNNISKKLLVICSSSEEHNTGDHQENALRTALLCGDYGCLRRKELDGMIQWINSDYLSAPPLCDLIRVHEYSYLQHLEEKCKSAMSLSHKDTTAAIKDLKSKNFPLFYAPPRYLDSDTPLQPQSLEAAKRFCGAAILAVDHIMNNYYESSSSIVDYNVSDIVQLTTRAFVIGRPPGHHAGPQGCVPSEYFWRRPDMASSGFCLLNTVAVAAAYARHKYGRNYLINQIKKEPPHPHSQPHSHSQPYSQSPQSQNIRNHPPRIAIIDIDIHHGNGTEEIIRNLTPHSTYLPLPSSWAPISMLSYKPWLDENDSKDVLFSSVHLYAEDRFYPCSGADTHNDSNNNTSNTINSNNDSNSSNNDSNSNNIINISLTPIGPGPWDRKARAKLSNTQRELLSKQASQEFKTKVTNMLFPKLIEFKPDLLFISAGFDAHYDDMYHFLSENDFHWITEKLCDIIDQVGGVGVISILEGGYSLSTPLPKSLVPSTRTVATVTHKTLPSDIHNSHLELSNHNKIVNTNTTDISDTKVTTSNNNTTSSTSINTTAIVASDGAISLGRGGRGKIKKEKNLSNEQLIAQQQQLNDLSSNISSNNHSIQSNKSYAAVLTAPKSNTINNFSTTIVLNPNHISTTINTNITINEHNMYAQKPGDGGLVKAVLAHTAALVGKKSWL